MKTLIGFCGFIFCAAFCLANNKVYQITHEQWNNNQWEAAGVRTLYQYNVNDILETKVYEYFDKNSNQWNSNAKTIFYNNGIGEPDSSCYYYESNGVNNPLLRTYFTYNGQNHLMEKRQFMYSENEVMDSTITTFEYQGNKLYREYVNKNYLVFSVHNLSRKTYTYNESDKPKNIVEENYNDQTQQWEKVYRYLYVYDEETGFLTQLIKHFLGDNFSVVLEKTTYVNDSDGNILEEIFEKREGEGEMKKLYRDIYSYSFPTMVEQKSPIVVSSTQLEKNYPNPFNPTTTIHYQIANAGVVNLKVYDVLGKEIATLVNEKKDVGKYSINFNASHLPAGIYFYRLQSGEFVETKKMVLLK